MYKTNTYLFPLNTFLNVSMTVLEAVLTPFRSLYYEGSQLSKQISLDACLQSNTYSLGLKSEIVKQKKFHGSKYSNLIHNKGKFLIHSTHRWFVTVVDSNEICPVRPVQVNQSKYENVVSISIHIQSFFLEFHARSSL